MRLGFNNKKYIQLQSEKINERIKQFGGKLYLEFGGKLYDDYHAARVLPGFEPDSKLQMLIKLKNKIELIIVINANDIEKEKVRGDLGITYDLEVLRLIDEFKSYGLMVGSVVITCFAEQENAIKFKHHLEDLGIKTYTHYPIKGYPADVDGILSPEGFGKNQYIETERELVVVTAPGPGSGKMATCLSQLYHESLRGRKAGYAKFETFPIWNLPLKHPVNIAYEAATVDLDDVNMIDPFHLDAYGVTAVNYNRDVEIFPVLKSTFTKILGESPYKSPTDMGVNMVGFCIDNDDIVNNRAHQEIIRRYYNAHCSQIRGEATENQINKLKLLMQQAEISTQNRPIIAAAISKSEETNQPAAAIELPDGRILTGKTSSLLGASSALLLNSLKFLADIPDNVDLISPAIIKPIQELKVGHLKNRNPRLHLDEVLIALSIASTRSINAKKALEQLANLKGCQVHSTVILSQVDEKVFKKLGIELSCEPKYQIKRLYHPY